MLERLKCRTMYRVKVWSKKSRRWEPRLWGCSKKSVDRAVELYRDKFGLKAKVEKVVQA